MSLDITDKNIQFAGGDSPPDYDSAVISVRGPSKHLGRQRILADINFDINRGAMLVVLGPSGGGKTTLLWSYFKSARLVMAVSVVLAFAATIEAQANRVPKSDNQSWNDLQIAVPMTKKVDFTLQLTGRFGDNITQIVDLRYGVGWVFRANKYLSFNPFYFHREARPPNGRHEYEDRITLGATLRIPAGKFTIADRNYFERRWREPQIDAWRYRNKVQIEHPFTLEKKKFTWFVSDEIFYDWSLHVWPRNRFGAGITHPFNKHLTLELYYTRQNDGRTRPGDLNIIWSTWRVRL